MKSHGGGTKDENSESLALFTIRVYPPFDQTTMVENRNVVVLKLGEVMLKR